MHLHPSGCKRTIQEPLLVIRKDKSKNQMPKFFRRIRQKLINERKARSYLLYAIGEILLVVIGILIALQVNNWNEKRKEREIRDQIAQELVLELKNTKGRLEEKIKLGQEHVNRGDRCLALINSDGKGVSVDTIKQLARSFFVGIIFDLALPSYEEARSNARLSLFKNKEILSGYANILTEYEGQQLHRQLSTEMFYIGPTFNLKKRLGDYQMLFLKNEKLAQRFRISDKEYKALLRDNEIYGTLEGILFMNRNIIGYLKRMKNSVDSLIPLLESYN